jgi:hypothetical protein
VGGGLRKVLGVAAELCWSHAACMLAVLAGHACCADTTTWPAGTCSSTGMSTSSRSHGLAHSITQHHTASLPTSPVLMPTTACCSQCSMSPSSAPPSRLPAMLLRILLVSSQLASCCTCRGGRYGVWGQGVHLWNWPHRAPAALPGPAGCDHSAPIERCTMCGMVAAGRVHAETCTSHPPVSGCPC